MILCGGVSVCDDAADVSIGRTQTFVKVVNYQHIMPTRYTLDVDLKGVVPHDAAENSTKRLEARKVPSPTPVIFYPPIPHLRQDVLQIVGLGSGSTLV